MTSSNRRDEIQKLILALLVTHKDAVDIVSLESDYMEQTGERVPWRSFGHVSFFDFLQNMPNVRIERRFNQFYARALPTEKSNHISSLVANQRSQPKRKPTFIKTYRHSHYFPTTQRPKVRLSAEVLSYVVNLVKQHPKGITKDFVLLTVNKSYPYINICLQDLEDQLRELSHEIAMEDNLIYPVKTNEFRSKDTKKIPFEQFKGPPPPSLVPSPKYYVSDGEDSYDECDSDDNVHCSSAFDQYASASRISCVDKRTTCHFLQESVTRHQEQLNNNIKYLEADVKDGGTVEKSICDNDIREGVKEDIVPIDDNNAQILVNDRLKFRLEKLIQKYTNGIWCAELPEKFLKEYNIELKYTELGFNSVREFAAQLKDIFHCVQPSETGDCILYNAKEMVPENTKTQEHTMTLAELYCTQLEDDTEAMPAIVSIDTSKKLIPEGVMTIGETVGQVYVESLFNDVKPFVEVYVVEVFTPSFFWVQLRKRKKSFDALMTQLGNFYTSQYTHYIIPPVVLEKGLNCACIYGGAWHRGIIKSVKPDLQVTVLFYDYGTVKTYPATDIYYLDRKFSYLPAQAIPCGLINTQPKDSDQWTKQVTYAFAVKTSDIPLVATIASIDVDNNSMMVTLTNTLEDEDVHINDWLVEQNLAVHGSMANSVDVSKLLLYEEQNLLLDVNQCVDIYDAVHNESNEIENAPLVSPQSTLADLPLPPPPGLPIPDTPVKLPVIQEESPEKLVDHNHNVSEHPALPISLQSNPFLQDVYQTNTSADRAAIESVIIMWRRNLELQIPIMKAYNCHLARVSSRTKVVPCEMIMQVERATNHLISSLNGLTNFLNDLDKVSTDIVSPFGGKSTAYSVPTFNTLSTALNVPPTSQLYTFPPTPVHEYRKMHPDFRNNYSVQTNILDDTQKMGGTILNSGNRINSAVLSRYDNTDNGKLCFNDNDLGLSDIAVRVRALTDYTNVYNSNTGTTIDFSESTSVESTPVRKETNPFKINFLDNDNILLNDTQRKAVQAPIASPKKSRTINTSNVNNSQQRMVTNLSNAPRYELFADKHELGVTTNESFTKIRPYTIFPPENKSSTSKRNLFGAMEDRAGNSSMVTGSYFTCNNQSSPLDVQYSTNINTSTILQTPFTVSTFPSMVVNLNLDDDGYLTRPSTSDTLESSSPSGLASEVDFSDQPFDATTEQSSGISAEAWIRSIENAIALNSPPSKHTADTFVPSDNSKCPDPDNTYFKSVDIDNSVKLESSPSKSKSNDLTNPMDTTKQKIHEIDLKNLDELSMRELTATFNASIGNVSPTNLGTNHLFFQVAELTQGPVYVFHFEETGWMSVDEFTENFTPFRTFSFMLNMKNILDVDITLRDISRSDYPSMFAELDSSPLKASRDSENKIYKISMISLRSGLKVLVKFKIIEPTDLNGGKYKDGSILHDINTLINTYKNLKRQVRAGP